MCNFIENYSVRTTVSFELLVIHKQNIRNNYDCENIKLLINNR